MIYDCVLSILHLKNKLNWTNNLNIGIRRKRIWRCTPYNT